MGEVVFDNSGNPQRTTKVISIPSRLSLSYTDIFVYNIKATQELYKKVIELETIINKQQKEITKLKLRK